MPDLVQQFQLLLYGVNGYTPDGEIDEKKWNGILVDRVLIYPCVTGTDLKEFQMELPKKKSEFE